MSWLGKILGGGIGLLVGGPIGMVLGAVLGHHAVDSNSSLMGVEAKQGIFFAATFSMLGKLAKADGVVTEHEIDVIDQVMRNNMRLSEQARSFAIEIFNTAKDSDQAFNDFAEQFYEEFGSSREVLVSLVELLLLVAHADGELHPAEEGMIREAIRIFRLEQEYTRMQSRFEPAVDIDHYYRVLGCEPGEEFASVKKKYRKLAMEYHPDRVQSQGVSPEFQAVAEEKFKEIQNAYDTIDKQQR